MTYFPVPPGITTTPLEGATIPPSYTTASANTPPPAYHPPSRSPSSCPRRYTDNELDISSSPFSASNLQDYSPSRQYRRPSPQPPRQSHPPSHSPSSCPPLYTDADLDTTSPHLTRSNLRSYSPGRGARLSPPHKSRRSNIPPTLSLDTSTHALSPSGLPKLPKGRRPYNPYNPGPQNRYSQLEAPTYEGPSARDVWLWGPCSRIGIFASMVVLGLTVGVVVTIAVKVSAVGRGG